MGREDSRLVTRREHLTGLLSAMGVVSFAGCITVNVPGAASDSAQGLPEGEATPSKEPETSRVTSAKETEETQTPEETETPEPIEVLKQVWEFKAGNTFKETPSTDNKRIYAPNEDRNLYAINLENGQSIWSYQFEESLSATPAVSANRVYTNKEYDNYMYSLDPESGDVLWKTEGDYWFFPNSPSTNGEYVFVTDEGVKAIDGSNGREVWNYDFEGTMYISSTTALSAGNVINSSEYGVFAVNQENGQEEWTIETSGKVSPDSLTTSDDYTMFWDDSRTLNIIYSTTGRKVVSLNTGRNSVTEASIIEGVLYYVDGSTLVAYDIAKDNKIWSSGADILYGTDGIASDLLEGLLFVSSYNGLVGISQSSGEAVVNHSMKIPYEVNPIVAKDQVVVANENKSLFGFRVIKK